VYKRLKVLTEKGKDRASVEIPYDARYVGVNNIRARTIAPDGTITPMTGKVFNSTIVRAQGVKYLAKTFILPNVQVGSIIEWKYTEYWDDWVSAPHWVVQDDLLTKRAKFTFVPMFQENRYVENSRGQVLNHVYYSLINLPENTAIKTTVNNRMELELKDIPAFEPEDFEPPDDLLKMRVNFYYGTDKMGKPQEFWKNEGKYWNKAVDKYAGHSGAVATAVGHAVGPTDTADQKARKIYAYVQKVKNLTFSEETLEEFLSSEKRARRSLEDVLKENAGYSNEIARLFLAMAKAANLQAYMMRVADRDEIFFQQNIPNPSQLTSEIVIVVVDGKEIFVDPGTPLCPFGHLAWQHTSTQGIRQTANGSTELASTPEANYKDAISKRVGNITISEDGDAKGSVGIGWTGEAALVRRLRGMNTDSAGRKKELEDELQAILPQGTAVQLVSAEGWEDEDKQLSATFKVEIPSYASNAGKRMLVPTALFESRNRQPFAHGERKQPVYFNFPYYLMDETTINFPASFQMENLPEVQPVRTDYSLYTLTHTAQGNSVKISRTYAMGGIAFHQSEYAGLRKFFDGVNAGDTQSLVLTSARY
jgi:hypothetical protein